MSFIKGLNSILFIPNIFINPINKKQTTPWRKGLNVFKSWVGKFKNFLTPHIPILLKITMDKQVEREAPTIPHLGISKIPKVKFIIKPIKFINAHSL